MANLSDHGEEGVSLFPMFNILACTLGVMVFVLATVATVSLGADKTVEFIRPETAEDEAPRSPTWAEWDGSELILQPSLARVRFDRDLRGIPTVDSTSAYVFERLAGTRVGSALADVALDPRRYLILLVRPSGFRTLPDLRGYLELLGIDVVQEPIDQQLRGVRVR